MRPVPVGRNKTAGVNTSGVSVENMHWKTEAELMASIIRALSRRRSPLNLAMSLRQLRFQHRPSGRPLSQRRRLTRTEGCLTS